MLRLVQAYDRYVTSHLSAVPQQALDGIRADPPRPRWPDHAHRIERDDDWLPPPAAPTVAAPRGTFPPHGQRRRPGPRRVTFKPPYEEDEDGYGNDPVAELEFEPTWSARDVAEYAGVSIA